MLKWHALWHTLLGGGQFLATNWAWVLAIVFLVLTIRTLLFPVFVKQIKSQRAMQALAPQIKALQEKHKGDRETLQREMMELYRREKTNPFMGCLPMLVQIPVMYSLYHVLRHVTPDKKLEATKKIYGWTVGQFDSASHAKLFGAPIAASFKSPAADLANMHANGTTVKIVAGVLVAIMIATTFLTSRQMILKTGWSEDPQQKMIQRLMLYGIPVSLLISGGIFPIGVVIYWTTTNLFSLGQQFWVLRKYPPPPNASKATGGATKSTAKGKGAPVKAAPSAAAKALAPKPGAKPVKKAATPTKATKATKSGVPSKATPARQSATPNGSEPANGNEPVDGGVAAPKPGARPVAKKAPAKKAPAKQSGPAKQTGAAKQGDTANRTG
jgi:YidC/Oxa1 family membrane protein insertase